LWFTDRGTKGTEQNIMMMMKEASRQARQNEEKRKETSNTRGTQ
jgi:hypothetical protein